MYRAEHKPKCLKFAIEQHVVVIMRNNVKQHTAIIWHNRSFYYLMILKLRTCLLSNQRPPEHHLLFTGCLYKSDVTWVILTSTTYGTVFCFFCTWTSDGYTQFLVLPTFIKGITKQQLFMTIIYSTITLTQQSRQHVVSSQSQHFIRIFYLLYRTEISMSFSTVSSLRLPGLLDLLRAVMPEGKSKLNSNLLQIML